MLQYSNHIPVTIYIGKGTLLPKLLNESQNQLGKSGDMLLWETLKASQVISATAFYRFQIRRTSNHNFVGS